MISIIIGGFKMMGYRKYQKEAVGKAIWAFKNGYRNVLIDAPTGFGKSVVNYVIAKYFGNAFYTTPQVVLLEQIEKDPMIDVAVVKGRENYPCLVDRRKTAANGPCITKKGFKCYEDCPYRVARYRAMEHDVAGMSFAYLIYDSFIPDYSFGERELLIVDEGDDLENWAVEFGSFRFKVKRKVSDIYEALEWSRAAYSMVQSMVEDIESKDELSDDDVRKLNRLTRYMIKLKTFIDKVGEKPRNWVFSHKNGILEVKPVNAGQVLDDLIWSRGEYRLISSATIIDRKMFCITTGLKVNETFMIKVPHTFPVENRKVYYMPVAKMTKELRGNGYSAMAKAIAKIVKRYNGMNGLVHCHSYELRDGITKELRRIGVKYVTHNSKNREEMFNEWIDDGGIFISVGFERGIDLKDDLCRFQVITKVPYPDLSDIRVNELVNNRKAWNWYRYQAIKSLVQASGRGVRSENDWCHTYILDESFGFLFRYKSQFPKWYVEAVEVVENGSKM